jgi:ribonuclease P protein subunit RPR2
MCKTCQSPMIPGKSAKVRLMSRKKKMIKIICCICKSVKRISIKRKHSLWFDQPQSLLEIFYYSLKMETNSMKTADSN